MSLSDSRSDWRTPAKKLARAIFTYGAAKYIAATRLQYMTKTQGGEEIAQGGLCESALAMVIESAFRAGTLFAPKQPAAVEFSLSESVAEALETNASARGLSIESYILRLVRRDLVRANRPARNV